MPKTLAAKQSEKRRLQRKALEKQLGIEETGAALGCVPGAPGGHRAGGKGFGAGSTASVGALCAKLRRSLESGDLQEAVEVFHVARPFHDAGLVDNALMPLLRSMAQVGLCEEAASITQEMHKDGTVLDMRQAVQVLAGIALRAGGEGVLALAREVRALVAQALPGPGAFYLGHFSSLLVQEFVAEADSGMQAIFRPDSLSQLARQNLCIPNLWLSSSTGGVLELQGSVPSQSPNMQKGDVVLVTRLSDYHFEASLEGAVTEWKSSGLSVRVNVACRPMAAALPVGQAYRVDKVANKTVLERQYHALRLLCECQEEDLSRRSSKVVGPTLRAILLAEAEGWGPNDDCSSASAGGDAWGESEQAEVALCCEPPSVAASPWAQGGDGAAGGSFMAHLNDSQRAAVLTAASRTVTLVQGPPGTGKTHTAVGLVEHWLNLGIKPVLAVADSNLGVDNLHQGLTIAGIASVRVGRSETDTRDPVGSSGSFKVFSECPGSLNGLGGQSKGRDHFFAMQKRQLKQADVVCCTCAGAGSDTLEKFAFPVVLVDEASQGTEPSVLVPLAKGAQICTMVGDHKQLGPTILNAEAREGGLDRSLFDRLVARGVEPLLLDVQYRMHPAIAAFPSEETYDGRMQCGVSRAARRAPRGFAWPLAGVPIAFVPCMRGVEHQAGSSFKNPVEANAVMQVLQALLSSRDLAPCDVGVITPYQEQSKLLKSLLPPAVEVSTVDGFQGREKEVICVSTVRANREGQIGFLRDRRRTNVTLTRARRGLIVCGHPITLLQDTEGLWGRWLAWARRRGLVYGGDEPGVADRAAAAALAALDMHLHLDQQDGDNADVGAGAAERPSSSSYQERWPGGAGRGQFGAGHVASGAKRLRSDTQQGW